ncbi:hypothetical protein [Psychromicrobium lacuslunae]|uniref:DinB-like domain-containing protein n=1 Tax=Psychromicrobium lacuslunae TaxID=1618207 RepID=A0A0D4C1Z8_9MICC|nr:hypothetical protein [Psychromicrobium lacuslunae]AJT42440.1 hypothetical protein UM93_14745 [Psychromicrobium lacuslunae]
METWGAALFGDPCRECGFDWSVASEQAIGWVSKMPAEFAAVGAGSSGREAGSGWSVAEYISHVADNLRQWSERVQAARLDGQLEVAGYDPDELAVARGYPTIPLAAALWSLELSAQAWVAVLGAAHQEGIELRHAARGLQRASDIARNNAHDAYHHLWDVRRILGIG